MLSKGSFDRPSADEFPFAGRILPAVFALESLDGQPDPLFGDPGDGEPRIPIGRVLHPLGQAGFQMNRQLLLADLLRRRLDHRNGSALSIRVGGPWFFGRFGLRFFRRDFDDAFRKVDAIVTPTSPTAAFRLGEKSNDPLAMYLADIYTVTADLAGIPGISVPCGETKEKLPIGLQILGKHFDESTILRLAHAYEKAA